MENEYTVLEKIEQKCLIEKNAGIPLIMIDTDDVELLYRIARRGNLVNLQKKYEEDDSTPNVWRYYEFLGGNDKLRKCSNLYIDDEYRNAYKKSDKNTAIAQEMGQDLFPEAPSLFILRIAKDTPEVCGFLRKYVNNYLDCGDNQSPLRNSCVLLYGEIEHLPKDLCRHTTVIEEEYPSHEALCSLVTRMTEEAGIEFEDAENKILQIAREIAGFRILPAERILYKLICNPDPDGQPVILNEELRLKWLGTEKEQSLLQYGGILELQEKQEAAVESLFSGMNGLKTWIDKHKEQIKEGNPSYMKGILLVGVPGCGKSYGASCLGSYFPELPLLKMSIDKLMGGLLGDSEKNLRKALCAAEAMRPCILWIDELDKGFQAVSQKNQSSNDTFARMFGYLLDWMQHNTGGCFIYATANDISGLPGEFFRNGRFDALFSVTLPTQSECVEIFRVQMLKAEDEWVKRAEKRGKPLASKEIFKGLKKDEGDNWKKTLWEIMQCFVGSKDRSQQSSETVSYHDEVYFLTGADIEKIVEEALNGWSGEKITTTDWVKMVPEIFSKNKDSLNIYGSGYGHLNKIAVCYIRILRENFTPVAAEDQLIFRKSDYRPKWERDSAGKPVLSVSVGEPGKKFEYGYDCAIYEILRERMNMLAPMFEENILANECR